MEVTEGYGRSERLRQVTGYVDSRDSRDSRESRESRDSRLRFWLGYRRLRDT